MALLQHKRSILTAPMSSIFIRAETDSLNHEKCIQDLKREFEKMDYKVFLHVFTKAIECATRQSSAPTFGFNTILFCAKFATACNDGPDGSNTLADDIFTWTLKRTSTKSRLRQKLCQFLKLLLDNSAPAVLNKALEKNIMKHLKEVLSSNSSRERTEAIRALEYFQKDSTTHTEVLKAYGYHLRCDPNAQVRKAVLNCIEKNTRTLRWILERSLDCDKTVRVHAYRHLGICPLRLLTVEQRLTCLERGLTDPDPAVLEAVKDCLLQWKQQLDDNIIEIIAALKQTETNTEVLRFREVTRVMLRAIFAHEKTKYLIDQLPISNNEDFKQCVSFDRLTVETALYWEYLVEYLNEKGIAEVENIIPDLSGFCGYVYRFCEKNEDSFQSIETYQMQLSLMVLLAAYDFRDEHGRKNCDLLLTHMLKEYYVHEEVTAKILACVRQLTHEENACLQRCAIIVNSTIGFKSALLKNDLMNVSTLKNALISLRCEKNTVSKVMKQQQAISELVERETNYIKQRKYAKSQKLSAKKVKAIEKFTNVLKPLLSQLTDATLNDSLLHMEKQLKDETIVQGLRIVFCMLKESTDPLPHPVICKFYFDIINHYILAESFIVRSAALKCGISFCLLYSPEFAKFMFGELNRQFLVPNAALRETCVAGLFEILRRYGIVHFSSQNSDADVDDQDTPNSWDDFRAQMLHILKGRDEENLKSTIIYGFCTLILDSIIDDKRVLETLLGVHLDPNAAPMVDIVLRSFIHTAIERKLSKTMRTYADALSKQAECGNPHKVAAVKQLQAFIKSCGSPENGDMRDSDSTESEDDENVYPSIPPGPYCVNGAKRRKIRSMDEPPYKKQ